MKRELKSMAIVMEESKDLKEDLERLQKMSYDERVKEAGEENAKLRKRNGQLLIENTNLQDEIKALKKGAPLTKPGMGMP
jgi:uncharacterized protein YciI